jgi:mannonate dehydratase
LGHGFHERIRRSSCHSRGRGDVRLSSYDHSRIETAPVPEPVGNGREVLWERLKRFTPRVIALSESVGLRKALHPDDPPVSFIAGSE